jgi:thiamine kinase-like enzyme
MDELIRVIEQLLPILRRPEITVRSPGGGLMNRNYRIDFGGESYVLRIPGATTEVLGIDRWQEAACARAAADAGVATEVVAFVEQHPALVTRFVAGQQLTDDSLRQPEMLRRVAQSMRRYHDHPVPSGLGTFPPFETVRRYDAFARTQGVPLPPEVEPARDAIARIEQELRGDATPGLCHNDLLPANFIDDGTALRIIDWEYGGLGDPFFDLGNLAVNSGFGEDQERRLLQAYFGAVHPEQLRRLRLMRLVSDMREATWGFVQARISRLHTPEYYLEYGRKHVQRFLAATEGLV